MQNANDGTPRPTDDAILRQLEELGPDDLGLDFDDLDAPAAAGAPVPRVFPPLPPPEGEPPPPPPAGTTQSLCGWGHFEWDGGSWLRPIDGVSYSHREMWGLLAGNDQEFDYHADAGAPGGAWFCAGQDAVMHSDRLALRDRTPVSDAESDGFVRSGGRECPKCGSRRCGFVRGLATGEEEPWDSSWDAAGRNDCASVARMCCASCLSRWDARYVPPEAKSPHGDAVCPMCARPSDYDGGDTVLLRDKMLQGFRCGGCGAEWYECWRLSRADMADDSDESPGLDDPDVGWTLGCGQTV